MSGTPSPGPCTGSGCCCWTFTTPPSSGPEQRNGCSAPTEPYELTGNVPGVVFPCGLTHARTWELRLSYGAANTCIALATARLTDVMTQLLADSHQPNPRQKVRHQNER